MSRRKTKKLLYWLNALHDLPTPRSGVEVGSRLRMELDIAIRLKLAVDDPRLKWIGE